jgi:hypothetical protein
MKLSAVSGYSSSKLQRPVRNLRLKLAGYGPLFTRKAGYSLLSPMYKVPKLREDFWPPPSSKTMDRCYSTLVADTSMVLGFS